MNVLGSKNIMSKLNKDFLEEMKVCQAELDKQEGIVVLSLFDGMAGGYIALNMAGVKVKAYYASEVDNKKIKIAKHNFPDIIHLGPVQSVTAKDLPKIDLLIGGSPCQGLSINGKQLDFEDDRSALVNEFFRIKKELMFENKNLKWFLENVGTMRDSAKKYLDTMCCYDGHLINSNRVGAQNRKRYYWSNLPLFDRAFSANATRVQDILDDEFDPELLLSEDKIRRQVIRPSVTDGVITLNPKKLDGSQTYQQDRIYDCKGRFPALTASLGNRFNVRDRLGNIRRLSIREQARLQTIPDWFDFSVVSDGVASHAIGDGWTVRIPAKIFENLTNLY